MTDNTVEGELFGELPFLPLYNQVLLPGAFARVSFKRSGPVSGPLLEHLLAQHGEQVLVAAVPVHESNTSRQVDLLPSPEDSDNVKPKEIATAARVLQVSRTTQTGGWVLVLEGWCRVHIEAIPKRNQLSYLVVNVEQVGPSKEARYKEEDLDKEGRELAEALQSGTGRLAGFLNQSVGSSATSKLADLIQKLSPPAAADMLASMLTRDTAFKQLVLEAVDNNERMRLVVGLLQQTLQSFKSGNKEENDASQKQLVIKPGTLPMLPPAGFRGARPFPGSGPDEDEEEELTVLMQKLRAAKPPAEVMKVANREHKQLKKSSEHHPGYAMSRAYLETLADLPWSRFSGQAEPRQSGAVNSGQQASEDMPGTPAGSDAPKTSSKHSHPPEPDLTMQEPAQMRSADQLSLAEARALLNKDHYGLDKVKDRIVQYLAVRRLKGADARAPILCFVGPPGTGKTSLASSIAKVLLRPFQRVSVGGVRDEAEIRGHRRTYIGAMPGRVIQALPGCTYPSWTLFQVDRPHRYSVYLLHHVGPKLQKPSLGCSSSMLQALRRSGVRDPVLLLDEVDKMGNDSLRGDPASALLEVLDPNQNQAFVDTYLNVPFDLSQVVFVATANQLQNMSGPLLDRLEIIQLSGYTLEEKRHIAERHLIPGLLTEHGLTPDQLVFPSEAISLIANGYTREAGVRSLSRSLAAVCRHVAVQIVSEQDHAQAQPHQEPQGSSDSISSKQQSRSAHPQSPTHIQQQQQQQQEVSCVRKPQDMHATSDQPCQSTHADLDTTALESSAAASAGPFFWGSLWGGLRGAFSPPRQRPRDVKRRCEAPHQQVSRHPGHSHLHPARLQTSHAVHAEHEHADANNASRQPHQHCINRAIFPAVLAPVPGTAGSKALLASTGGFTTSAGEGHHQGQASNLCFGVNADMVKPAHSEVGLLTVTAELIEEVLGPRKYNETDSADYLVAPGSAAGLVWTAVGGQVMYVECCCTSTGQPNRPGKLVLTGQAGEVLQESAQLALSWIRSHTQQLARAAAAAAATSQPDQAQPTAQTAGHLANKNAVIHDGRTQLQAYSSEPSQAEEVLTQRQKAAAAGHGGQPRAEHGYEATTAQLHDQTAAAQSVTAGPVQLFAMLQSPSSHASTPTQTSCAAGLADSQEADVELSHSSLKMSAGQTDIAAAAAQWDVHVHLPAGAVAKDGPSAGITLATAMVSLFLGRSVRADTAMTGELTLRGLVLPIGGLKEKLLAAHHAGIKRVLVPKHNWRGIQADIPDNIKGGMEIIPVHVLEDVLQQAFTPPLHLTPVSKL